MGVRITDSDHVALYDSVTDMAFGPIFEDEYEAQSFLDGCDSLGVDLRELDQEKLQSLFNDFKEQIAS